MNNTEEQHPVFIPRNFIEKGTFMGGMFKIRNAIEGGILAILITIPVVNLPLTLTVRIIILCMTALPAAMISLIGIGGESIEPICGICPVKNGSISASARNAAANTTVLTVMLLFFMIKAPSRWHKTSAAIPSGKATPS